MEFVRQRSNFILGWQAAAAGGAALGEARRPVRSGSAGVPPLGSWMILPQLTSPATRTVLPSNDALYGATHVELDLLGPMVVSVPANVDDRYFSVSVMDAHMNNVDAHRAPLDRQRRGRRARRAPRLDRGRARRDAAGHLTDAVDLPVQPHAGPLRRRRPRPGPPLAGRAADHPAVALGRGRSGARRRAHRRVRAPRPQHDDRRLRVPARSAWTTSSTTRWSPSAELARRAGGGCRLRRRRRRRGPGRRPWRPGSTTPR